MRKPVICTCENKDADQLRGNREADQRLCFRYTDSTIPLLPKSEVSSLQAFSVTAQPVLCQTWSEIPKTGFLRTWLIWLLRDKTNGLCTAASEDFVQSDNSLHCPQGEGLTATHSMHCEDIIQLVLSRSGSTPMPYIANFRKL